MFIYPVKHAFSYFVKPTREMFFDKNDIEIKLVLAGFDRSPSHSLGYKNISIPSPREGFN